MAASASTNATIRSDCIFRSVGVPRGSRGPCGVIGRDGLRDNSMHAIRSRQPKHKAARNPSVRTTTHEALFFPLIIHSKGDGRQAVGRTRPRRQIAWRIRRDGASISSRDADGALLIRRHAARFILKSLCCFSVSFNSMIPSRGGLRAYEGGLTGAVFENVRRRSGNIAPISALCLEFAKHEDRSVGG